jgi:hypothetical protein
LFSMLLSFGVGTPVVTLVCPDAKVRVAVVAV